MASRVRPVRIPQRARVRLKTFGGAVLLAVVAIAAERSGHVPFPWIDLLTGYSLFLAGLLTLVQPRLRVEGLLLIGAGATWFLATAGLTGSLADEVTFIHRGLIVHAVVAASRPSRWMAALPVIVVAYVASTAATRAFSTAWQLSVAAGSVGVLILGTRRAAWRFALVASCGIVTWTAAVVWLRPHHLFAPAERSMLYGLGVAVAASSVAARNMLVRSLVPAGSDIVRDEGTGDARVGFRDNRHEPFRDITGAVVDADVPGSFVLAVSGGGETAIVHPGAAASTGAVRRSLLDAASLLRAHRDALISQRITADEIAASEQRIRAADRIAAAELARDLDQSVLRPLVRVATGLVSDHDTTARAAVAELALIEADLRTAVAGLMPSDFERGLGPALDALAARSAVPIHLAISPVELDPASVATCYFVASEAITNAVRHGHPQSIAVRLAVSEGDVELTVTDDGAASTVGYDGGGLRGLRQRVAAQGGTLAVRARVEGGTVVTARLPLGIAVSRPG